MISRAQMKMNARPLVIIYCFYEYDSSQFYLWQHIFINPSGAAVRYFIGCMPNSFIIAAPLDLGKYHCRNDEYRTRTRSTQTSQSTTVIISEWQIYVLNTSKWFRNIHLFSFFVANWAPQFLEKCSHRANFELLFLSGKCKTRHN